MGRMRFGAMALAVGLLVTSEAHATGPVCDVGSGPTNCINAIEAAGGVVNDIFKDAKGRDATQLPVYGTLVSIDKIFPLCTTPPAQSANCAGCNPGTDTPPADCPGQYTCAGGTATVASVGAAVNGKPDHTWGHPCRISDHTLTAGCPNYASCVADGAPGNYNPWEGFVFDLGGPSNQVAIFAMNDHGPQPCESAEYTVFLTNDPKSRDILLTPTTTGADPGKWNRAVLKKIYTWGWYTTRAPDPAGHGASCGDTATYAVENDSMVTVYQLPCGINFRYAAIVAGNDGRDFPDCAFDSQEAELDSVAGLTESGDAVCPDKDGDTFVDCACTGAPTLCDCDDNDPNTHPNAPEACNAGKDYNCNGVTPEPCPPNKGCSDGLCVPFCSDEIGCGAGSSCMTVDGGQRLCVPTDCTVGGCPPGSTCDDKTKKCVPNCDTGVVCPPGEKCITGECVDPCRDVTCQAGFSCIDGVCNAPCNCFADDVGCTGGEKCDRPTDAGAGTNQCVTPDCVGVTCPSGKYCKSGACVDYCTGVKCPPGETCVPPTAAALDAGGADAGDAGAPAFGCVNLCAGVTCASPMRCDPATGKCVNGPPPDGGIAPPPNDGSSSGGPDAGG
ncbi:MAG TPA: MopE-related protein, partial [Labilithrix sp.]